MVDGIVQEEHLGRLHEDRHERQQAVFDDPCGAQADPLRKLGNDRPDGVKPQDGEQHAQNADREVIDQHLESGLDLSVDKAVELFDDVSGQGPHNHRADEHGDLAPDDHPGRGDRTDHPAPLAGDVASRRVGDKQRQQVNEHRIDELRERRTGPPARGNEEGRDEAPGDKGADVGHDHRAQGPAESLDVLLHMPVLRV